MRFKNKFTLRPRLGEERVVRKFLLFPRRFNRRFTRWLEYANIIEQVQQVDVGGSNEYGNYAYQWVEVGFADYD